MLGSLNLLQYFNLGIISIIALFAIIGFIRGTRKSIFYFVATLIVFGLGWILMKPASSLLMSFNLSSFGFNVEGVSITSLDQSISELIKTFLPEATVLMEKDTLVKELVYALSTMVIKLVYFIVLIILAFTLFKVLTDVFWLVFKPNNKKGFTKKNKSFGNRMIGFGIGGFKGLFYVLLICFPIAGIASIASSLSTISQDPSEDLSYNLVFVNNQVSLVETSVDNKLGELDQILDILGIYDKSIAGKVFGTTKVDKFLFDGIFSFEIDNKSIKLRKELEIVSKALSKSKAMANGNFDIKVLLEEDPLVLKSIIDDISSLELIKIAVPVGIEVALYLEDKDGNNIIGLPESIKSEIDLKELVELNLASDVKKLGYAFVDFTTIYSFNSNEKVDYLSFDPEIVKDIMSNVGNTQIVDKLSPIAITYVSTLSTINSSLSKFGLTIEDLKLDEVENWGDEISQFGIIYEKLFDLQIKKFDENETFEFVTEEKVNALSSAIFESSILSNAVPVLVESLSKDFVLEEYKNSLIFDDINWDENEFSNVINAAVSIIKSGIIKDPNALKSISDSTIDELAKYLSKSKFITENLNVIIESVVNKTGYFTDNNEVIKLTQDEWTEEELLSLFKTTRLLVEVGPENILSMEDNIIRNLANNLSNSKFITRNIDTIIDVAFKDVDLGEITLGNFEYWSDIEKAENEFYYLIKSAQLINSKGNDIDSFLKLTDQDLDILLNSQIISETLVNILKVYSKEGNRLDLLEGVENPDIGWYDEVISNVSFTLVDNIINITKVDKTSKYYIYKNEEKIGTTKALDYEIINYDQEASYNVIAVTEGELRKMFKAISALTDSITANEPFTTDILTNLTDEEIDNIMESDILVLSLIKQLEEMSLEADSFVVIPEGNLKSTDEVVKLDAWKDKEVDEKLVHGELSNALRGLRLFLSGVDIDNFTTTSITNLTDSDIYEILKSDVLAESIIVQIEKLADDVSSVFDIPSNAGLGKEDSRDAWKNIYEYNLEGKLVPIHDGELTKLLRAVRLINTQGDIENIDVNNILEEANREIVLDSLILEETIINKVISVSNENSDISIPNKYKQERNPWKKSLENGEGELRRLLKALSYIMDESDSINNFTFDLGVVIQEKDEILKSDIIVETIINKIEQQEEISIPASNEFGLLNTEDRSAWKNDYALDESNNYIYVDGKVEVLKYGELSRLIKAIDKIVKEDPITKEKDFENISFDLNAAFGNNQSDVLDSLVISETLVQKIFDEAAKEDSQIEIPSSDYVNTLEDDSRNLWFNEYKNGVLEKGELAYLLDAVEILIGSNGNLEDLNIDFKILFNNDNQNNILKSKVISESIVHKIFKESNNPTSIIKIPNKGYVERLEDNSRTKWFNSYNEFGNVETYGEISHLIEAIEALFGDEFSFETFNFELNTLFDVKDTLLKSTIISEIIVRKIFEVGKAYNNFITDDEGIIIPSDIYLEIISDPRDYNRINWFNSYDVNGNVIYGEISYLLDALELLGLSESKFNELSFNLNAIFDDNIQEKILKSKIVSETIIHKINNVAKNGNLHLPSEDYVDKLDLPNRDKWFNDYSSDRVIKGEISYLLEAVEIIIGKEGIFESIEFDLSEIYDDEKQLEILKSKVISETMVNKVFDEADKGVLTIPSIEYVNPLNDRNSFNRDKWFNYYGNDTVIKGELANLLEASERLLEGASFNDINFDLNVLFDKSKQREILRSYVISETIISKIINNTDTIPSTTLPKFDLAGRPLDNANNRAAWYNEGIKENELAKFLDSIALILGTDNTFAGMGKVTIDEILELEFNVVMNEKKEVISSDFDILLDSIIMEYIISPLVVEIATESSMLGNYLLISNDYYFKKEEVIANNGTFDAKLYDTKSFLDSLYLLNDAGFHYTKLGTMDLQYLTEAKIDALGNSMVASRVFKGSISQMFNSIGKPYYDNLPNSLPMSPYVKRNWDEVKFDQNYYNNTTSLEAHTIFKEKLTSWTNFMTFYEYNI